jgi:hypothetical protein
VHIQDSKKGIIRSTWLAIEIKVKIVASSGCAQGKMEREKGIFDGFKFGLW